MIDFFEYAKSMGIDNIQWSNFVYGPQYLHVSVLPREYREKVVKELEDYFATTDTPGKISALNQDGLKFFKNQMLNNDIVTTREKTMFKDFIVKKDKMRGTNIFDSCPEFKDIWDDIV